MWSTRKWRRYWDSGVFSLLLTVSRLLVPLLLLELLVYVVVIVLLFALMHPQWHSLYSEFRVEICIIIPILFIYCDWRLLQEWFDKRRCVHRFRAILDQLMYLQLFLVMLSKVRDSPPSWNDLSVEFEEGEVQYVFLYRDSHWMRWPLFILLLTWHIVF